jgi:hypothetical protein
LRLSVDRAEGVETRDGLTAPDADARDAVATAVTVPPPACPTSLRLSCIADGDGDGVDDRDVTTVREGVVSIESVALDLAEGDSDADAVIVFDATPDRVLLKVDESVRVTAPLTVGRGEDDTVAEAETVGEADALYDPVGEMVAFADADAEIVSRAVVVGVAEMDELSEPVGDPERLKVPLADREGVLDTDAEEEMVGDVRPDLEAVDSGVRVAFADELAESVAVPDARAEADEAAVGDVKGAVDRDTGCERETVAVCDGERDVTGEADATEAVPVRLAVDEGVCVVPLTAPVVAEPTAVREKETLAEPVDEALTLPLCARGVRVP